MPDRLNHRMEALVRKLLGDDLGQTPVQRRTLVFSTDAQQDHRVTDAWDGAPRESTAHPSPSTTVKLDVEALLAGVYTKARAVDQAGDAARLTRSTGALESAREAESKARAALFTALVDAVDRLIAFADARLVEAGRPAVWGELAELGLYPLTDTLCMRDAPSYLGWDWMLKWKDPGVSGAVALAAEARDRADCCRLVEIYSYVYRSKFTATLNAVLGLLVGRPYATAALAQQKSWLGRAGAALKAAPAGDDPVASYARQKFAASLFQTPPGVVDLSGAGNNGEALVLGAGASWDEVKHKYAEDSAHPAEMIAALAFRQRTYTALLKQIADDIMSHFGPAGSGIGWLMAGSATFTSDVDVSLKGDDTASVVAGFNQAFTDQYTYESGYVLDVNIYAQDYIPDPGWRFIEDDRPGADLDFHGSASRKHLKSVVEHQDALGLLKIRRYMPDAQLWTQFTTRIADGLYKGLKAGFTQTVAATDQMYAQCQAQLETERALASTRIEAKTGEDAPEKAVEIAAANRLYERLCREAEVHAAAIRKGNLGDDDRDKLLEKWWKTQGIAQFFANEAYHTAGAMRYVVDVMQSQNARRTRLAELRDAFNEQLGDCLKEVVHLLSESETNTLDVGLDDPSKPSALEKKVNKYISRLGHIALSMLVAVVHQLTSDGVMTQNRVQRASGLPPEVLELIPQVSAIAAYGDALVAIKEKRPVNDLAALRQAAGFTDAAALIGGLLDAAVAINVVIRNHNRQTELFDLPTLGDNDEIWSIL